MKSLLTLYKSCGSNGEALEKKLKAYQLGKSHKAALYGIMFLENNPHNRVRITVTPLKQSYMHSMRIF